MPIGHLIETCHINDTTVKSNSSFRVHKCLQDVLSLPCRLKELSGVRFEHTDTHDSIISFESKLKMS